MQDDPVLSRYPNLIQASLALVSIRYGIDSNFLEELFFELATQTNLISSYVYIYNTEKIDIELTDLFHDECLKNIRPLCKNASVTEQHLMQAMYDLFLLKILAILWKSTSSCAKAV